MLVVPPRFLTGLALAIAISACDVPSADPRPAAVLAPSSARLEKPSAPVDVALDARALGGGRYAVTLTAQPTRDVPALELMVDGRRQQLGPVAAGETRTLKVQVALAGAGGRDVVGGAATGTGNLRRTRAAITRIGAPPVPQPAPEVRVITLSDGTELAEVRQ